MLYNLFLITTRNMQSSFSLNSSMSFCLPQFPAAVHVSINYLHVSAIQPSINIFLHPHTSSSAVTKKLRDASWLSVVSFNGTKRRVELFIVSYVICMLQICHCVQLNALFCCLWHNVEASCHKNFVVLSRNQHCRLLPAMCHNLRDDGCGPLVTVFTTPGARPERS